MKHMQFYWNCIIFFSTIFHFTIITGIAFDGKKYSMAHVDCGMWREQSDRLWLK